MSAGDHPAPPLTGLRVVDLSTWIAGGYCTKLLADGGAEVIKIEPPDGDPLRRWSASGADTDPELDGALFNHLHTSKRSIVVDPGRDDDLAALHGLLATADVVVWSAGATLAELDELTPAAIRARHPQTTVVAISPYGLDGPWEGRPAAELTLQAWSGGVIRLARGRPDRPPTYVGGQVGEWLTGAYAAVGALASRRRGGAEGELVDVSMLESLAACLTYYPVTFHDQLGRPIREDRFVPTPGVAEASDGTVGLGTGTGQQWLDFCAMVGRPDWAEEPAYLKDRTVLAPEIDAWVAEHTVEEVLDLASAFRLPNAPIANGANVTGIEQYRARETFVQNPRDRATNPRPPFRFEHATLQPPAPAPRLGELSFSDVPAREVRTTSSTPERTLPFDGLRVLDMTAFWAGPVVGHTLALLGAEVIHVESPKRPDSVRYVGGVPQTEDHHLERSPIFAALNTNKKSLAVDLSDERGVEALRRVVATCDVVVENYTPRVLDQLGLDHETLRELRPDLITVRMPGFGLDGPWRDKAAFAFVIEDASGLTWLSGHPDVPPIEPYSLGDPNAGLHALFGLQLALEHRDRTGQGGLVECAMVDAALNITAEQVIEHSAYGALLNRSGNRGPCAAPQNLYQVAGVDEYGLEDNWVAIAVATDEQWQSLRRALGDPEWAADPDLDTATGRVRAHERIDEHLQAWCRDQDADVVVERLWGEGVPVAAVLQPHHQVDLPPLQHRRFFEELEHPVIGRSRYSTLPLRFSDGPDRHHHRHAPLLGEHTTELLGEVGLSRDELDALESEGIIASLDPYASS